MGVEQGHEQGVLVEPLGLLRAPGGEAGGGTRSWPSRQGITRLKSTRWLGRPGSGRVGAASQPRSTSGASPTIGGLPAKADGLW